MFDHDGQQTVSAVAPVRARARAKANVWENFANSNQWLLAAPCAGVIGAPGGGGGVGGGVAA